MKVRAAEPSDAERIAAVARTAWHAAYGEFLSADAIDATVDEWYAPESLRSSIDREEGVFVVAVADSDAEDDEIVGFLQAGYSGSVGNVVLGRIYALPEYWESGVGSAMLGCVARDLDAEGYERISAVVLADNDVGRAFYDARTFEEIGRQTTTFGGEEHEEVIVAADIPELTDLGFGG
jgi:ribosomal protein S18 acetylase RimI-like enzyme